MAKKVNLDTLRSLAFGGISGVYAAIGSAFTVAPRIVCITNGTNGNLIISDDNTNATGKLILLAGTFKLFDFTANIKPRDDDDFVMAKGTILYVKQETAPTSGSVYVELVYA